MTSDRIPNTNLAPNPAPCLLQVPYDAGFILVRNGALLRETFYSPAAYLAREGGGLMGGSWWPTDYGPDLSRGCRAMKTWFTLKVRRGGGVRLFVS